MHLQKFTEEEVYAYLDQPYNPPNLSDGFTEEHFFSEWHTVRNRLKEVLDSLGKWDAYGQGDYYLDDSAALLRGIGVSITSEKMLAPKLIPQVANLLKTLDDDFEVEFGIDTEEGVYEVFVSTETIKAWCPDTIMAKLLPKWIQESK